MRRMRLLVILFILLLPPCLAAQPATQPVPVRALFDEAIYWADTSELKLRRVLERTRRAGFDTYIPCVWHGQGAKWPTDLVAPWYRNPTLAGRDPLRRFIELAREYDIRVMPCFTLMLRQHDFLREFVAGTGRGHVFNVHDPAFRRFARDLVLDVALRYEVDGVNLDYVRAGQVCHDPACRADYAARTGGDLMTDLGRQRVDPAAHGRIVGWQRAAMRELLSDIVVPLRGARPGLLVTVDAAPWSESVIIEGQDSLAWADEGLVDVVFSMNYQDNPPWEELARLRDGMRAPARLALMVSAYSRLEDPLTSEPRLRSRPGAELVELVGRARAFNAAGHYAVYLYSMLSDDQVTALAGVYRGAE